MKGNVDDQIGPMTVEQYIQLCYSTHTTLATSDDPHTGRALIAISVLQAKIKRDLHVLDEDPIEG